MSEPWFVSVVGLVRVHGHGGVLDEDGRGGAVPVVGVEYSMSVSVRLLRWLVDAAACKSLMYTAKLKL